MSALIITREITDNFPDGRPCPPIDELDRLWVLVRRLPDQQTLWRMISLKQQHAL